MAFYHCSNDVFLLRRHWKHCRDKFGSNTPIPVGPEFTKWQKMSKSFSALGDIAFAYSFALIMIEIQDTVRAPKENKQMRKASLLSVITTTIFYLGCGCFGYAAFGHSAPGNLLAGFGANEPRWLITFANACIVIHIIGGYQVYCQPLFGAFEYMLANKYPDSKFIREEYPIKIMKLRSSFNMFRLVWRTIFVVVTTLAAMAVPFFNEILALLGALTYWPLSIMFPILMYIAQKKMKALSIYQVDFVTASHYWLWTCCFGCNCWIHSRGG